MTAPVPTELSYRDGVVDARLAAHDEHFRQINGSIERSTATIGGLERSMDKLTDKITELISIVPKVQTIEEERIKALAAANALKEKAAENLSFWERQRSKFAWGLGVSTTILALVASADSWLKLFT